MVNAFPQKAQGSPTVMEVAGDAPDWLKAAVAQLRFTKIFTRWFNSIVFELVANLNIKLFDPVLITVAPVKLYASTNMRTNLNAVTLSNVTAAGRTVDMWIIKSGAAVDDAHAVLVDKAVAADSSVSATEILGQALEDGDELWASCDLAASVTCSASGTKERMA